MFLIYSYVELLTHPSKKRNKVGINCRYDLHFCFLAKQHRQLDIHNNRKRNGLLDFISRKPAQFKPKLDWLTCTNNVYSIFHQKFHRNRINRKAETKDNRYHNHIFGIMLYLELLNMDYFWKTRNMEYLVCVVLRSQYGPMALGDPNGRVTAAT